MLASIDLPPLPPNGTPGQGRSMRLGRKYRGFKLILVLIDVATQDRQKKEIAGGGHQPRSGDGKSRGSNKQDGAEVDRRGSNSDVALKPNGGTRVCSTPIIPRDTYSRRLPCFKRKGIV
jgi:hypothetical protein